MGIDSKLRGYLLGCSWVILAACATTTLRTVESDPVFNVSLIRRVLVINMSPDAKRRAMVEGEFVRQWKEKGVDAVASHTILPPEMKLEKGPIAAIARAQKFDSVLVTRLLGSERIETKTSEDDFEVESSTDLASGTTAYAKAVVASPQYASNYRMAAVTTRVYQVETEKRVWTCITDTLVAEDVSKLIDPFVKAVLKALYRGS